MATPTTTTEAPAAKKPRNGFAVAALILGILGGVLFGLLFGFMGEGTSIIVANFDTTANESVRAVSQEW